MNFTKNTHTEQKMKTLHQFEFRKRKKGKNLVKIKARAADEELSGQQGVRTVVCNLLYRSEQPTVLSVQAGELPAAILPIDGVDKGGQLVGVDSLKDVGKQKVSTG